MSLQDRRKSKKGISIIIGYVLLVTFAIIIGVIVYRWMKTYVPQEDPSCPDGSTLFIESSNYDCDTNILTFKIINNGNYDMGGYFIYGSDRQGSEIAPLDLTRGNMNVNSAFPGTAGVKFGSFYYGDKNDLSPGESEVERYNLTQFGRIYSIEIIPFRWQPQNRKTTLISCSNSKLKEMINCFVPCTPDDQSVTCAGIDCGTVINNCGDEVDCGDCTSPEECNILGQCVDSADCSDTCPNPLDCCEGLECGSVCGEVCGGECADFTNGDGVCDAGICVLGTCTTGFDNCDGNEANGCETTLGTQTDCSACDDDCGTGTCVDGYCETGSTDTCNGVWEGSSESSGVECDGISVSDCNLNTCQCNVGYDPTGEGGCWVTGTYPSCGNYCQWLETPVYTRGDCRQNSGQCNNYCGGSGTIEPEGAIYCGPPPTPINCCCCP